MTPIKNLLGEYDDLKRMISKKYKELSVFNTQEHVKLIIDGIRCFIYSILYKGVPVESAKEQFKIEVMCRINRFLENYKDENIENENEKGIMQWVKDTSNL